MIELKNNNGTTYRILAYSCSDNGNVYLLDDGRQFVVARNWSDKYQCWDAGSYFIHSGPIGDTQAAMSAAQDCYMDHVSRMLYSII